MILDPGSCIQDPGSRLAGDPGSRIQDTNPDYMKSIHMWGASEVELLSRNLEMSSSLKGGLCVHFGLESRYETKGPRGGKGVAYNSP